MPNLTQYYLDGTNLSLATCVFLDAALTTVAPQGYYGDGAIIRYQTVSAGVGVLGYAYTTTTAD